MTMCALVATMCALAMSMYAFVLQVRACDDEGRVGGYDVRDCDVNVRVCATCARL